MGWKATMKAIPTTSQKYMVTEDSNYRRECNRLCLTFVRGRDMGSNVKKVKKSALLLTVQLPEYLHVTKCYSSVGMDICSCLATVVNHEVLLISKRQSWCILQTTYSWREVFKELTAEGMKPQEEMNFPQLCPYTWDGAINMALGAKTS